MATTLEGAKIEVAKDKAASDNEFENILDTAVSEMESEGAFADPAPEPAEPAAVEPVTPEPGAVVAEPEPTVAEPVVAADPAPAPADPVVDPLADTAPLDYALDGQAKAFDGILIDKTNGGAFILPDKLDAVRTRLADADRAHAALAQSSGRLRQYDELSYTTGTKDAPQTFRGVDAFVQAQADANANAAFAMAMLDQIKKSFPVDDSPQGRANAQGIADLMERAQFRMEKVAYQSAQQLRGSVQSHQQEIAARQGLPTPEAWFTDAISAYQKAFPALTAADIQAGRDFFAKRPQMVYRIATAQDAAKYKVRVGSQFADPDAMNEWFTERAALRAQAIQEATARATAATAAGKHNAAVDKGRQPAKPAARRSATPATTQVPEKPNRRKAWADPLNDALQELGISD